MPAAWGFGSDANNPSRRFSTGKFTAMICCPVLLRLMVTIAGVSGTVLLQNIVHSSKGTSLPVQVTRPYLANILFTGVVRSAGSLKA